MKKLLNALAQPEQGTALAGVLFDFGVAQPVSRYVAVDSLLPHLDRALAPEQVERVLRVHVRPAFERERVRARTRGDKVGDWLSPAMKAELRALAAKPVPPDRAFLEAFVKQDAVQHLLRSIIQETLERFLHALKSGGEQAAGGVGGLVGAMGRGAFGMANSLSKGLLGGLGAQVEQQLKQAANTFIANSMNLMMERLVVILVAPETAQRGARMVAAGFDKLLELRTSTVLDRADRLPQDALWAAASGLLAHNLARPEVRAGLLEEARHALELEGARSVADLLEEAGALEAWRAEFVGTFGPWLNDLSKDPAFKAWTQSL